MCLRGSLTSQAGRPVRRRIDAPGGARGAVSVRCRRLALAARRRTIVAAALLALVAAPSGRAATPEPVLDVEGMTFVSSRGETNELVLHASEARFETAREMAHLQEVQASVAESDEREGFEMTCERGELNLATNDFYAEGDVVGHTSEGRIFRAPWVRYDHEQGLLFTDAPVLITEPTGTYRGGGFRYFVRERRFRLLGGASVVQEP